MPIKCKDCRWWKRGYGPVGECEIDMEGIMEEDGCNRAEPKQEVPNDV